MSIVIKKKKKGNPTMNELLLTVIKMIGAASIMLAIVNMSMFFIVDTYVMLRIIKKYTKGSAKAIAKEMSEEDTKLGKSVLVFLCGATIVGLLYSVFALREYGLLYAFLGLIVYMMFGAIAVTRVKRQARRKGAI